MFSLSHPHQVGTAPVVRDSNEQPAIRQAVAQEPAIPEEKLHPSTQASSEQGIKSGSGGCRRMNHTPNHSSCAHVAADSIMHASWMRTCIAITVRIHSPARQHIEACSKNVHEHAWSFKSQDSQASGTTQYKEREKPTWLKLEPRPFKRGESNT